MNILYAIAFLFVFQVLCSCNQPVVNAKITGSQQAPSETTSNIVYKSTDGGESWQNISTGLPKNMWQDGIRGKNSLATKEGLFLRAGNVWYHNAPNAAALSWSQENLPDGQGNMAANEPQILSWSVNVKSSDGTDMWSPIFEDRHERRIRSYFETANGDIFIAIDRGIIRTTDKGKTWKQVYAGPGVGNLAASNGVLLAVSMHDIIRSTDNGEHWTKAIGEDSVAWDVKPFRDGFVAITAPSLPASRRLSTSFDGGKTWQSVHSPLHDKNAIDSIGRTWNNRINDRLRAHSSEAAITPAGAKLFAMHRDGIFTSTDKGKTWKLSLPAVKNKVFILFVCGNTVYAIATKGGC